MRWLGAHLLPAARKGSCCSSGNVWRGTVGFWGAESLHAVARALPGFPLGGDEGQAGSAPAGLGWAHILSGLPLRGVGASWEQLPLPSGCLCRRDRNYSPWEFPDWIPLAHKWTFLSEK